MMKKNKKIISVVFLLVYSICYLYFFFVFLSVFLVKIGSHLPFGELSAYFDSDWMLAPALVCGLGMLISGGVFIRCTYGVLRRLTAISPAVGVALLLFSFCSLAVLAKTDSAFACGAVPLGLGIYMVLLWVCFLRDLKTFENV